ncbi:excitatory amino acid transporter 3-like isoform X2 [Lineus longissimus]|uniref:excitatory amino acid transporter 3-like isoform X2 n=1 Tax=Lineus longissimus TaxID=88925 RepID=UPI002B4F82D9
MATENGGISYSSNQVALDGISGSDVGKESPSCGRRFLRGLKKNLLLLLMILGIAAGIGMGAGIRMVDPPFTEKQVMYFRFPGDILMRMLKMLILPLIVSTLIAGLASLDARASGRMGLRAVIYYFSTTIIAVIIGMILVSVIQPGAQSTVTVTGGEAKVVDTADAFLDLIRNCFPDNIVVATFKQSTTAQVPRVVQRNVTINPEGNSTAAPYNTTIDVTEYDAVPGMGDGMNVLGLVVFSIALGLVISKMGKQGEILTQFFEALGEATMRLVAVVIWYSPVGIMFLVAAEIIKMPDPAEVLRQLGLYMATVLAGLAIHSIIVLPLIYFVCVRKNPFKYIAGVVQAMITAFGTSSSSATLPVTYHCLEDKNGVDRRVTRFVLPVGATINMDGTALYEAVAAVFIAQLNNVPLDVGKIITISVTATVASIGAAGVPQAGLVTMLIVLTAVGLPTEDVTKILAVDWLLDRFRTTINVMGDAIGAGVVEHLSRRELKKLDRLDAATDAEKQDEEEHTTKQNGGFENKAFTSNETTTF